MESSQQTADKVQQWLLSANGTYREGAASKSVNLSPLTAVSYLVSHDNLLLVVDAASSRKKVIEEGELMSQRGSFCQCSHFFLESLSL